MLLLQLQQHTIQLYIVIIILFYRIAILTKNRGLLYSNSVITSIQSRSKQRYPGLILRQLQ